MKNGMGAAAAEKVLQVTESILHEVSSTQQVLERSIRQEVRQDISPSLTDTNLIGFSKPLTLPRQKRRRHDCPRCSSIWIVHLW